MAIKTVTFMGNNPGMIIGFIYISWTNMKFVGVIATNSGFKYDMGRLSQISQECVG